MKPRPTRARFLMILVLALPACGQAPPPPPSAPTVKRVTPATAPPAGEVKRVELGRNIVLETIGETRRVRVQAEVCFREGALELLLCRKNTKEHEAVLSAAIDARHLHAALLAAGAKAGSPAKFEPTYTPAHGTPIAVTLEFERDGMLHQVPAQEWILNGKTHKPLEHSWVFAGSVFYPNEEDPKQPPLYAANGGHLICVANFGDSMLDLPVASSQDDAELVYEANTEKIPQIGTAVTVILEPKLNASAAPKPAASPADEKAKSK